MLNPFHHTTIQRQHPGDFQRNTHFCEWLFEQHEEDNAFITYILSIEEACFTLDVIFNSHNRHTW